MPGRATVLIDHAEIVRDDRFVIFFLQGPVPFASAACQRLMAATRRLLNRLGAVTRPDGISTEQQTAAVGARGVGLMYQVPDAHAAIHGWQMHKDCLWICR